MSVESMSREFIAHDWAGWNQWLGRFTHCPSGKTLLCQPWMDQRDWDEAQLRWFEGYASDVTVYECPGRYVADPDRSMGTVAEVIDRLKIRLEAEDQMKTFQQVTLDRLEKEVTDFGFTCSQAAAYGNVGMIHVHRADALVAHIYYDFQFSTCRLSLTVGKHRVPSQEGRPDYFDFYQADYFDFYQDEIGEPTRFWTVLETELAELSMKELDVMQMAPRQARNFQADFATLLHAALGINDQFAIGEDHVEFDGSMNQVESFRELTNALHFKWKDYA